MKIVKMTYLSWLLAIICSGIGVAWLHFAPDTLGMSVQPMTLVDESVIVGPLAVTMDSSPFVYTDGWQVTDEGADPTEPTDPWQEPAGTVAFTYRGNTLALLLAPGNYWGYLYVTVDGQPANLLPNIAGNLNHQGVAAGYRTLYTPEAERDGIRTPVWVTVHHDPNASALHEVEIEIWRSWGQTPLRGVAIDALPAADWPQWPAVALLIVGGWCGTVATRQQFARQQFARRVDRLPASDWQPIHTLQHALSRLLCPQWGNAIAIYTMVIGLVMIAAATIFSLWPVTWVGLLLLAWSGLQRPVLWFSGLLFGLPFYYSTALPLLANRAFGLIDLGIFGGLIICFAHWLLHSSRSTLAPIDGKGKRQTTVNAIGYVIGAIVCWALLATVDAAHGDVAWREWRVIFLYVGLFAGMLAYVQRGSHQPIADQWWLVGGWLAGSTVVALIALWQYGSGTMLIDAEGVQRVRALYGSPNNLALYLERALAVTLAYALFATQMRQRWLWVVLATIQGGALLLTFSKGALFLGLPAIFVILFVGGLWLIWYCGHSSQSLWWLAGAALLVAVLLLPFLSAERFQRLLDLEQGTGFLRLQLWRSSWQMALDHPWFGVGPDNFLYAYRSYYLLPTAWQEPDLNHPHNWPLDWWTRLGFPGLLLAVGWFVLLIWRQWRAFQQETHPILALGLLAAVAAALAHGLIDASYALPDLMLLWGLFSYLPLVYENQRTQ